MWKLAAIGYVLTAAFFGLWLHERDSKIKAIDNCNAAVIQSALDAERLSHAATRSNYEQKIRDLASQADVLRESLAIAENTAAAAQQGTAERDETITRLKLEAYEDEDDIPDSGQCLNAFVPEPALDRVLHTEACRGISPGARPGAGAVCAGADASDRRDSASGDFSDITYADALRLWGRDRDTIETLNGRLRAIAALGDKDED